MQGKAIFFTVAAVALVAMLALGYWLVISGGQKECAFCKRPIRTEARAVAQIDGKREETCCARCVLTEAHRKANSVRLLEVTDFNSKRALKPADAWFVEGSREVACDHDMHMDHSKHGAEVHFDRCSPGALAFATEAAAQAFAAERGGTVRRWAEMEREATR